jgi:hypothetical protein
MESASIRNKSEGQYGSQHQDHQSNVKLSCSRSASMVPANWLYRLHDLLRVAFFAMFQMDRGDRVGEELCETRQPHKSEVAPDWKPAPPEALLPNIADSSD